MVANPPDCGNCTETPFGAKLGLPFFEPPLLFEVGMDDFVVK